MNQRQVDLALLVGIGVLLVVILVLALSGAPLSAAGDISDPVDRVRVANSDVDAEDAVAESASAPEEASAQAERGTTTVAEVVEAVTEGETTPAHDNGTEAVSATGIAAAPSASSIPIERIGFAYATGSEGACGVPLTAWGYVAVSRDLLAAYPCGSAVTLTLDEEIAGRREVTAQVGDTMGADITATVNIFVGEDEPALEYGVTSGTLSQ